jgi:hypothetical protein
MNEAEAQQEADRRILAVRILVDRHEKELETILRGLKRAVQRRKMAAAANT